MSAPTVTVTATINSQDGLPIEGATVTMVLDRSEVYQGFVVKESVSATTNALGVALLDVFPNELGTTGSQYKVSIITPEQTIRSTAVVPNSACNLHDIMLVPPYPPMNVVQSAVSSAQGYASTASAASVQAGVHAAAALVSQGAALASASTATIQAGLSQSYSLSAHDDAVTASNAAITATAAAAGVPVVGSGAGEVATNSINAGLYAPLAHVSNAANPHGVTKLQVGLGAVSNAAQVQLATITASGSMFYGTGVGAVGELAAGTDGEVLTLVSGLPSWEPAAGGMTPVGMSFFI